MSHYINPPIVQSSFFLFLLSLFLYFLYFHGSLLPLSNSVAYAVFVMDEVLFVLCFGFQYSNFPPISNAQQCVLGELKFKSYAQQLIILQSMRLYLSA